MHRPPATAHALTRLLAKPRSFAGPGSSNRSPASSECLSWELRAAGCGGREERGGLGRSREASESLKVCGRCRASGSGRFKYRLSGIRALVSSFAICSPFLGPRGVRSGPREPPERCRDEYILDDPLEDSDVRFQPI
ncbi:General Transcription Factor Ii-I Repeat Domain-Containing Protein 2A [Manis pentadactyla]|nr:General Transcription Factor Ii-I Repeat Domain-Containing Protein 2A [Manis pentadactyla]